LYYSFLTNEEAIYFWHAATRLGEIEQYRRNVVTKAAEQYRRTVGQRVRTPLQAVSIASEAPHI
jgi:hypothetical protein